MEGVHDDLRLQGLKPATASVNDTPFRISLQPFTCRICDDSQSWRPTYYFPRKTLLEEAPFLFVWQEPRRTREVRGSIHRFNLHERVVLSPISRHDELLERMMALSLLDSSLRGSYATCSLNEFDIHRDVYFTCCNGEFFAVLF